MTNEPLEPFNWNWNEHEDYKAKMKQVHDLHQKFIETHDIKYIKEANAICRTELARLEPPKFKWGKSITEMLMNPPAPNKALKKLMQDDSNTP